MTKETLELELQIDGNLNQAELKHLVQEVWAAVRQRAQEVGLTPAESEASVVAGVVRSPRAGYHYGTGIGGER